MARLLHETIRRMPPPPDGATTVAVDGTGLAPGAISPFFVNRACDHGQGVTWRHWLTWVVVVDLPRQIILAQAAKRGPTNDGPTLRPLLDGARHLAPIRCVLADGEFDSELNQTFIRQGVGADSLIPAVATKRGKRTWHWHGVRAHMRADFPVVPSRQRPRIESVCSATKRKQALRTRRWALGAHAADASPAAGRCLYSLPPPFASPVRSPLVMRMSTKPNYVGRGDADRSNTCQVLVGVIG